MRKVKNDLEDDLRPEYDLKRLRIRKVGPKRTQFGGEIIQLAPDVAEVFPDSASVNEALRFLIRITRENRPLAADDEMSDKPVREVQASAEPS